VFSEYTYVNFISESLLESATDHLKDNDGWCNSNQQVENNLQWLESASVFTARNHSTVHIQADTPVSACICSSSFIPSITRWTSLFETQLFGCLHHSCLL